MSCHPPPSPPFPGESKWCGPCAPLHADLPPRANGVQPPPPPPPLPPTPGSKWCGPCAPLHANPTVTHCHPTSNPNLSTVEPQPPTPKRPAEPLLPLPGGHPGHELRCGDRRVELCLHPGGALHRVPPVPRWVGGWGKPKNGNTHTPVPGWGCPGPMVLATVVVSEKVMSWKSRSCIETVGHLLREGVTRPVKHQRRCT